MKREDEYKLARKLKEAAGLLPRAEVVSEEGR